MSEKTSEQPFHKTFSTFRRNLESLKAFTKTIGRTADEHDEKAVSALHGTLKLLCPTILEEASNLASQKSEPAQEENRDKNTIALAENDLALEALSDEKRAAIELERNALFEDHSRRNVFFESLRQFNSAPPVHGRLLRRGALITLMSYFEALISDLIYNFYNCFPEAMPTDRTLTLVELREAGSIGEAEHMLVAREIESVLRDNLDQQLAYFTKRLKVNLDYMQIWRDEIVEIDTRRNIFVHNNGVVNRAYTRRVTPKLAAQFKATEGKPIGLTDEYLVHSISIIEAVGTVIAWQCWKKWKPAGTDQILVDTIYESLENKEFSQVTRLSEYAYDQKLSDSSCRLMVCVNHAIALREQGQHAELRQLISKQDWSSASARFKIALHILQDEEEKFFELLPKAVAAEEIDAENLREWPLFWHLREQPRFVEACLSLFPKENWGQFNLASPAGHLSKEA